MSYIYGWTAIKKGKQHSFVNNIYEKSKSFVIIDKLN